MRDAFWAYCYRCYDSIFLWPWLVQGAAARCLLLLELLRLQTHPICMSWPKGSCVACCPIVMLKISAVTCHVPHGLPGWLAVWLRVWLKLNLMRIGNQNLASRTRSPDKVRCVCVGLAAAPPEINYLTLQLVKRRDNAPGGRRRWFARVLLGMCCGGGGCGWLQATLLCHIYEHNQQLPWLDLLFLLLFDSRLSVLTVALSARNGRVFGLSLSWTEYGVGGKGGEYQPVLRWLV